MAYTVNLYSYTKEGKEIADRIMEIENEFFRCEKLGFAYAENNEINEAVFYEKSAHVFICAAGIAVRKTAPFILSKITDPAVIVIDEKGENVIPILSGHIGGANDLARLIAKSIGANVVLTTATDVNGFVSIDDIAATNRLNVKNKNAIKIINSKILKNIPVGIWADENIQLSVSDYGIYYVSDMESADVIICSVSEHADCDNTVIENADSEKTDDNCCNEDNQCDDRNKRKEVLYLQNKRFVIGIGCRKNTDVDIFEETLLKHLSREGIDLSDIDRIASIDLKKEEMAIKSFASKYKVMFETYSADELNSVSGNFDESDFVKEVAGVSNVSERSAAFAAELMGTYSFLAKRISENGITISIAEVKKRIVVNGKA